VGTGPAIVIRDRPGLYPLLLSLDGVRDLEALRRNARREIPELDIDVAEAIAPLVEAGAVVDNPEPRRRAFRVELARDGPSTSLARTLGTLLRRFGVTFGPDGDLLVVLSSGQPDRATLADVVQCRIAHLVVVQETDTVCIGPLVVPGRTPCVACADLRRSTWDPAWEALVPQFGRTVRSGVSTLTLHAAAAEIAAACLYFADRTSPGAVSRPVVAIGPDRVVRVIEHPAFHPRCTCALLS